MKTPISPTILLAVATGGLACAHAPSKELVNARQAYENAEVRASAVAPAEVYEAKKALNRAERAHDRKPASLMEKDLAYVAGRKAQYAIAYAEMKEAKKDQRLAAESKVETLEAQRDRSQSELSETKGDLTEREKELARAQEHQADLEGRLNEAMSSLHEFAQLKREKDRMVITLNGSVIFKHDSTELLPAAKRRLAEVATVLQEYDDTNEIVVEGHTDATGKEEYNRSLSRQRANSVRDYLVSQGVDSSSVSSVGKGESDPVASNKTSEGRANNRRVEIIIEKSSVAQR
jgi:outer membrane protein OmpA-like peptidoglycan-associated protein